MKHLSNILAIVRIGCLEAGLRRASVLTLLLAACSPSLQAPDSTAQAPNAAVVPSTSNPSFLRHDPTGPGFSTLDTSFVAVAGQNATLRMFPAGTQAGSDRFLDFDLNGKSLYRYPPGHPRAGQLFSPGDTITITVRIDPVLLSVEMGPEGLSFDPNHPASLELSYRFADSDFNGDGTPDPALEPLIGMYRQAAAGAPWIRLDGELDLLKDRVKFDDLTGFSRYALAF